MIVLLSAIIITNCERRTTSKDTNIDRSLISSDISEGKKTNKTASLEEQIRDFDESAVLLFQEEGNFTNSGYKEILAFYESKSTFLNKEVTLRSVSKAYCFICDELNQMILRAIKIQKYGTAIIDLGDYLDNKSMSILGREIRWKDQKIGYIGDFNNNGRDELYFFEASGMGTCPRFYEFDGNDFKEILDDESYSLDLVNMNFIVDENDKKLTFESKGDKKQKEVSFIWNNDIQLYEETKVVME